VAVLLTPIKTELRLSDTQLGFLSGLAFALFYAVCGIPLARVADRRSRRNLMGIALLLWSAITTLGGLVQNFAQLLLVRFGVGIGEAGYAPAAFSMISDYFPPARRQLAAGLMNAGPPVGIMLGLVIGCLVAPAHGWRAAFLVAGIPGLLFAMLFVCTVREPVRGQSDAPAQHDMVQPPFLASLATLWRNRSYRYVTLTTVLEGFSMFALSTWMPSFFERSHHLPLSTIGPSLGLAVICGALGSVLGGMFGDRLARIDVRWPLYMASIGMIAGIPLVLMTLFLANPGAAILCYGLFYFALALAYGPQFALCTATVPLRLRALALSVLMFASAVIAFGLGPLATGMASDALTPALGAEALRAAMAIASLSLIVPAILGCVAAACLNKDLIARRREAIDTTN